MRGDATGKKRRVLFRDADVKITRGMRLGEVGKTGAARHRRGDRNELLVVLRKFCQRFADDLRISRRRRGRGFAALDLVFAETMELIRLFDGRLVAFAFFRENMEQHRLLLRF